MEIQWKELIERAKNDDQDAFSALYEHSYDAVYRTVKSMVKDEETAMDIVQDTFVSGFANLDGFQPPENFIPWLRRIATNKVRDWFRKKHDIAFSQLADEEDDLPEFEDETPDHSPEAVLDRSETTRLIEEILGALSEEQRIAVGMYYYEEMPVAEIAETLGVSENTVKSRLNYGRKKIKAGVEELEKKGTKLYSLAPIPFLIWLLRCQTAQPATGNAPLWLLEKILAQGGTQAAAGATGTAAATGAAATAAKTGLLSTLGAKIAAGVLAVALVGGVAAAVIGFANRSDPAPETTMSSVTSTPPETMMSAETQTNTPTHTDSPTPKPATNTSEAAASSPNSTASTAEPTHTHSFSAATCTKPKTCSVCGETEGEALGHTPEKANYQDAVPCSVCGEAVDPLTPDFVTYGIVADMKVGETYDYETIGHDDPTQRIKGTLTVWDYIVVASDATHEAKEGYEWRIATFILSLPFEQAYEYGFKFGYNLADYYDSRLLADSGAAKHNGNGVNSTKEISLDSGNGTFLVNYHGREMECYFAIETVGGDRNRVQPQVSVQVPVGYDGIVYGYRDGAIEWPESGAYISDLYEPGSYLLFRFA